jgi:hypothetical protein
VEELFTYWNLDDYEDSLEELEDALIVSSNHDAVIIIVAVSASSSASLSGFITLSLRLVAVISDDARW